MLLMLGMVLRMTAKIRGLKVGNHEKITKYKNIFAKCYTSSWSGEVFMIKKVKSTIPWTYVISDLNSREVVGIFCKKLLPKTS